jgi:hypothetical protein
VRLHREVASSGAKCSSCKPMVLVTLGGCHLLDVLWLVALKHARRLCMARRGFVRGIVLVSQEPRRATLVKRVIELPSLMGRFLRCTTCGLSG